MFVDNRIVEYLPKVKEAIGLYLVMCKYADESPDGTFVITQADLADELGVIVQTVRKWSRILIENGLITFKRGTIGNTSTYSIADLSLSNRTDNGKWGVPQTQVDTLHPL